MPGELVLRDGTPAMIWPLLPTDAGTLRDMFRRLSPGSRWHRFLATVSQLDDPMIRLLVDAVDGVHHIALLLVVLPPEGEEQAAGVARLIQYLDDPGTADIAVTVVDDWQRRGAGTLLVSALLRRRPPAVTRLRTIVAADNHASLALLGKAGRLSPGPPDRGVISVVVDLPAMVRAGDAREQPAAPGASGAGSLTCEPFLLLPRLAHTALVLAVEGYFDLAQRMIEMNRELTVSWVAPPGTGADARAGGD